MPAPAPTTPAESTPPAGSGPPADAPEAAAAPGTGIAGHASTTWALVAHLSALATFVGIPWFVGPLVVWLLVTDRDPFARDQAAEALNFNLSVLLWGLVLLVTAGLLALLGAVGGVLPLLAGLVPLGLLGAALAVAWFVLVIVASVRAASGTRFRYPLTIRFVS